MGSESREKQFHLPRLLALAVACLLVLAFGACGSDSDGSAAATDGGASETTAGRSADVTIAGRTVRLDPEIREQFPESILERGRLNLGFAPTAPRIFRSAEGSSELTGVDFDLANAVGALSGLRPELMESNIDGLIPGLAAGKMDVIWSGLLPTPERLRVLNILTFTEDAFGLLVPKDNPHQIERLEDLCGLTAAVVQGGAPYFQAIDEQNEKCEAAGREPIRTRTFASADTAILAVKTGQVDAEVVIASAAQYAAKSVDGGDSLKAIPLPPYFEGGYGFGKDDAQLAAAVKASVQRLMDDGTLEAIMEQYGVGSLALDRATLHER